jgi:hypothetical protein
MATDDIIQRLREEFRAEEPDVVSFSGKTEVVEGMRRVFLTPEMDTFIAFSADVPHLVVSVDGVIDKVWVSRTQPLVVNLRRAQTEADWFAGSISNARFSAEVVAVDLARLYWQDQFACAKGTSTVYSKRCGEELLRLTFGRPGPPLPGWPAS